MQLIRLATALTVVVVASMCWASPAQADEDFRSIVRQEIENYMAAQKASKPDAPKPEAKSDDGNVMKVYWKNGLRLDTKDGNIKLKIGGRAQFDGWVYSDDDYEARTGRELNDGVEFRRLRLYNAGQIGKHVKFKAQIDFAANPGDAFSLKDVYIDLVNLGDCFGCGFPSIRFGHSFAPYSLEAQTSSKYITFMERSVATNMFSPSRLSGVTLHESWMGDHLNVAFGAYVEGTGNGEDGSWESDGWSLAARIAYAPWWDCDCKCNRWQIGASAWSRQDLTTLRYRQRAPTHVTGYRPVDTRTGTTAAGDFAAESALHYGVDTIFTYGPWSVQAEYFGAAVDAPASGDPTFSGWYAYVSYWLTGECRPLSHSTPGRVSPCCDWLDEDCCCKGGWELAARVDSVDMTDGAINGGEMMTYTLGVNWHLNPNTRIMWNVLLADVDSGKNAANQTILVNESFIAFGMRVAVNW